MIEQTQGKFYTNVNLLPANRKEKSRKNTIFIWDWTELGRSWWKHFFPKSQRSSIFEGSRLWGEGRKGGMERTPNEKSTTQGTFKRSVIKNTHFHTKQHM